MDAASFSVMAYETAPKCENEIGRFSRLLRMSFGDKQSALQDSISQAFECLEVMSTAMSKYALIQDRATYNLGPKEESIGHPFSDLDTLDYEYSTAHAIEPSISFPQEHFHLARKSYYQLLTYVMALLRLFSEVFPRSLYSRPVIDSLWKENKMSTRTAWIEKQLAGWDVIERAVLYCRDWHSTNPALRNQAIRAVQDWGVASRVLSGAEEMDVIHLRIISVSDVPKASLFLSNTSVSIVFFDPSRFGGPGGRWQVKTPVAQKTQDPVWNKTFPFKVPKNARFIDINLYDRVIGIDKMLSKVRLKFSLLDSVEAALDNRSLVYGIDGT